MAEEKENATENNKVDVAERILKNDFKKLTLEKLETIWNKICNSKSGNKKTFEREINKLKKYFPCLDCENCKEDCKKKTNDCGKIEIFSDGRYGGSVFDDMKISIKSENKLKELIKSVKPDSSVAKLFYAMSWKNGDLNKEENILNGWLEAPSDEEISKGNQKVFFQFGKFLRTLSEDKPFNEVEPIIDQHTMRAFVFWQNQKLGKENEEKSEYNRIKDTIPIDIASKYWDEYRNWYKKVVKNSVDTDNKEQAFWLLNHIMFVLGKAIKPKN